MGNESSAARADAAASAHNARSDDAATARPAGASSGTPTDHDPGQVISPAIQQNPGRRPGFCQSCARQFADSEWWGAPQAPVIFPAGQTVAAELQRDRGVDRIVAGNTF